MKASIYNNFFIREGWLYAYNSLTDASFKLPKDIGEKLRDSLSSPYLIEAQSPILLQKLIKGGFLVEDNFDELNYVKNVYKKAVDSKDVFLCILPTMNCNYKCWYCYQDHIPSMMSEDVMNKVRAHVDYLIDVDKISSLRIDWFGGEPLMYFNKVIKPLSEYILAKCSQAGIPFSNSSTINAFFLNQGIIDELDNLNFHLLHTTLDGSREFHDSVKFHNTIKSAFDHSLHNITNALKRTNKLNVLLRINYTAENLKPSIVDEINERVPPELRSRIRIYLRQVWQDNGLLSYDEKIRPLIFRFESSGFQVEYWNRITDFVPCYVNKNRFVAISPKGEPIKCTAHNDFQLNYSQGEIRREGQIVWNADCYDDKVRQQYLVPRCLKCTMLQSCMGPCPKNLKEISNEDYCKYGKEYQLSQRICDYIDSKTK